MQDNLNIINARVNMAWCERKQGGNGGRVEEGRGEVSPGMVWSMCISGGKLLCFFTTGDCVEIKNPR